MACEISASVRRLYQLCKVLYSVAQLYVEAKASQAQQQQQQQQQRLQQQSALSPEAAASAALFGDASIAGSEFDMYLSQLGFMPTTTGFNSFGGGAGAMMMDGSGNGEGMMQAQPEQQQHHQNYNLGQQGQEQDGMDDETRAMMAQTAQLGDWFSGNRNMMGMLEEDLSGIDALMS